MTDVTAVGIFAYYLPRSVYRKIATPVLRHWFAMTWGESARWFAMTARGEAALPSLVGKVAHAKRVTDELSSRFRNNSVPLNGKS